MPTIETIREPARDIPIYRKCDVLVVGGGGGFVTFVTLLVNVFKSPTTLDEKVWTPPTTDAARSAPGREDEPRPPPDAPAKEPPEADVEGMLRYIGS